jgi:hypothetical protein
MRRASRQLGDVAGDPSRLIADEQMSARPLIQIKVTDFTAA